MFREEGGKKRIGKKNHIFKHENQRLDLESIFHTIWRF